MAPMRRRQPRQPIKWHGRCRLNGQPDAWMACTITDASLAGAALLVPGAGIAQVGEGVVVELERVTVEPLGIQLRGTIRSVVPPGPDGLRLGVEFTSLTNLERSTLQSLLALTHA